MSTSRSARTRARPTSSSITGSRQDFAHLRPIEVDDREYPDYPGIAQAYAEAVVAGRIIACRYVKLACRRYLTMLTEAASGKALFYFSVEDAVDVNDFLEKLPLSKGGKKGQRLVLAPWQIFSNSAIFGFRRKDPSFPATIGTRLVRQVYLEVPRGSGKSEWLAGLGLYCFTCEDEEGSQIFIGAPKEDQADKVFGPMKSIVEKEPELASRFGLSKTQKHITKLGDPSAEIRKISSIAETEDGHDPHVTIMEELHAQDPDLYDVMHSAQGKRLQNLFISITTAGRRATGIAWEVRARLINTLEGRHKELSFFGLIYTVDADDLKHRSRLAKVETWTKANPMWGITLDPSQIREAYSDAKGTPARLIEFERTRLNIWSNGAGALVSPDDWDRCYNKKLKLDDFSRKTAWIGGDLATKRDIAAIGIIFNENNRVQVFNRYYIPASSPKFESATLGPLYQGWVDAGWLIKTPGSIVDYSYIEADIRSWCTRFDVQGIGFDKYQSNQILARLFEDGLPAIEVGSGVATVSDPSKDLFALIATGVLEHDGNPVTGWMAMNVVGYVDKRENLLPQKDDPNSENKIDGIAALVTANVLRCDAMLDIPTKKKHPWARRGNLLGFDGNDRNQ